MEMNENQREIVNLTIELNQKAERYSNLCEKLEKMKRGEIHVDEDRLKIFEDEFQKNYNEIVEIRRRLDELK